MKVNISVLIIRAALVLIFLFGIFICVYWYPSNASVSAGLVLYRPEEIPFNALVIYWSQLAFYWAVSIPCFIVVILGFKGTMIAGKEGEFSLNTAKLLFKMALILFIASIAFIIGTAVFGILEWNYFSSLYYAIGGVGVGLSGFLYIAYKFMFKVSKIKEDSDSIL